MALEFHKSRQPTGLDSLPIFFSQKEDVYPNHHFFNLQVHGK